VADKNLENGPLQPKGCTDILCCLLFIVFLGAFGAVFVFSLAKGKPQYLAVPYDENGNACGLDD
jgi:solute carrier family 44 (choline transporter-like protein), member 2/4/5